VKLPRLLRAMPSTPEAGAPRRRRRAPRPDGPKTIVPVLDDVAATPFALSVDAARERLRRAIPPVDDGE
jgi:hypothetical protein